MGLPQTDQRADHHRRSGTGAAEFAGRYRGGKMPSHFQDPGSNIAPSGKTGQAGRDRLRDGRTGGPASQGSALGYSSGIQPPHVEGSCIEVVNALRKNSDLPCRSELSVRSAFTLLPVPRYRNARERTPHSIPSTHARISATPSSSIMVRPSSGMRTFTRLSSMRNTRMDWSGWPGTME